MSDPVRFLTGWPHRRGNHVVPPYSTAQIIRRDPFTMASYLIARHELRVWFEPDWGTARLLARRFPHCLICAIPVESNTESLRRVPGWRPRRNFGVI